jgi:hypothetical protein
MWCRRWCAHRQHGADRMAEGMADRMVDGVAGSVSVGAAGVPVDGMTYGMGQTAW